MKENIMPNGEKSNRNIPLANPFLNVDWLRIKNLFRKIVDSEARNAQTYPNNYTFVLAYKDARSKGQKTFFWKEKYYSTNYEGDHGKLYKKDIASGKADAWQRLYPNFTNPELRKEKEEELATYGITNELTRNKNIIDIMAKKIPARGYNINDAISAVIGEHHTYSSYNTPEELRNAFNKKYPQFKNVTSNLEIKYIDTPRGKQVAIVRPLDLKKPEEADLSEWEAYKNELDVRSPFSMSMGAPEELHRSELNYLLGFPSTNHDYINKSIGNYIKISKYRTGNLPYYYTTPLLEKSLPFIPLDLLNRKNLSIRYNEYLDSLYSLIVTPNVDNLPEKYSWEEYQKADAKDMELPLNKKIYLKWRKAIDELESFMNNFTDRLYKDSLYFKKWQDKGINLREGNVSLDIPRLINSNILPTELDTLQKIGALYYIEPLKLTPGNHLANTHSEEYYDVDNEFLPKGKYGWLIDIINPSKEDHNKYSKQAINTEGYIYSEPSLGTYTMGVPQDTSFVSAWDKFDLDPFGSGNDKPIIILGKPFEYYTRFYPKGKTPNIDSLYQNFKYKKGGRLGRQTR